MISFILIAPWLSTTHSYDDVFEAQPRLVNKSWYVPSDAVGCAGRANRSHTGSRPCTSHALSRPYLYSPLR